MAARRCSPCGLSWPHKPGYAKCKQCGESTDVVYNGDAMSGSEANHIEFEAFFKEWEAERAKALAELEAAADAAVSPPDRVAAEQLEND